MEKLLGRRWADEKRLVCDHFAGKRVANPGQVYEVQFDAIRWISAALRTTASGRAVGLSLGSAGG